MKRNKTTAQKCGPLPINYPFADGDSRKSSVQKCASSEKSHRQKNKTPTPAWATISWSFRFAPVPDFLSRIQKLSKATQALGNKKIAFTVKMLISVRLLHLLVDYENLTSPRGTSNSVVLTSNPHPIHFKVYYSDIRLWSVLLVVRPRPRLSVVDPDPVWSEIFCRIRKNHSESVSGQPGSGMNLNLFYKIHNLSIIFFIQQKNFLRKL